MLKNIQNIKYPLLKPDFRIRTHAQSNFIHLKRKKNPMYYPMHQRHLYEDVLK